MVLHARGAQNRNRALMLFALQLVLNFSWSPVFFAFHQVQAALSIIAAMVVVTVVMIFVIWRIRMVAALLLYPYLGWLMFASVLNYQILALNPNADTLAPPAASTDIPL
jgi:tryptophan-rich sensory protein